MQIGGRGRRGAVRRPVRAGLAHVLSRVDRAHAQVSGELGNGYADVVAAADVALYGGLCALATLERPELRSAVVDNVAFREFLDAHPEARRLASWQCCVTSGRAISCCCCWRGLQALRKLKSLRGMLLHMFACQVQACLRACPGN